MPASSGARLLGLLLLGYSASLSSSFLPRLQQTNVQQCNNPVSLEFVPFVVQRCNNARAPSECTPLTRILSVSQEGDTGASEDLENLQALFSKHCDSEGLMNKAAALRVPFIAELLVSKSDVPFSMVCVMHKSSCP
jgi:hypothetical protein